MRTDEGSGIVDFEPLSNGKSMEELTDDGFVGNNDGSDKNSHDNAKDCDCLLPTQRSAQKLMLRSEDMRSGFTNERYADDVVYTR